MIRQRLPVLLPRRPTPVPLSRPLSTPPTAPPRPPRPSLLTLDTLYPFLLLSLITSLALNLGHSRSSHALETARLRAQISVLERVLAGGSEDVERELALVGLGASKGEVEEEKRVKGTTWREVLLGKKGEEWERTDDGHDEDWEKIFKDAEEADRAPSPVASLPPPAASIPPPASSQTPTKPFVYL